MTNVKLPRNIQEPRAGTAALELPVIDHRISANSPVCNRRG